MFNISIILVSKYRYDKCKLNFKLDNFYIMCCNSDSRSDLTSAELIWWYCDTRIKFFYTHLRWFLPKCQLGYFLIILLGQTKLGFNFCWIQLVTYLDHPLCFCNIVMLKVNSFSQNWIFILQNVRVAIIVLIPWNWQR